MHSKNSQTIIQVNSHQAVSKIFDKKLIIILTLIIQPFGYEGPAKERK